MLFCFVRVASSCFHANLSLCVVPVFCLHLWSSSREELRLRCHHCDGFLSFTICWNRERMWDNTSGPSHVRTAAAADNIIISPLHNSQDVVMHFLGHEFISCPCYALCAFDVMFFLMRMTARHMCSFHYCRWMRWSYQPEMIGTAVIIFISLSLTSPF